MAIETQSIANEPAASPDGAPVKSVAVPFAGEAEAEAKAAAEAEATAAAAVKAEEEAAAAAAAEAEKKPEKTDAERERARMQRGIDRRTKEREEARAEAAQLRKEIERLTQKPAESNNPAAENDSEPLSLTRAELAKIVKAEAERLAPTLSQQQAEFERRRSVIQSFEDKLGAERFNKVASDLDDALDGLKDSDGKPKAVVDAVFEADDPVKVVEWLADPDNHAEAQRISKLSATQAGKAIAKLELKFDAEAKEATAAKAAEKAKAKPIPSSVPAPLEPVRGQGSISTAPDPSDTKAWIKWRNAQTRIGI